MKTAGRKNDGAWFRTNKAMRSLDPDEIADLKNLLVESVGAKAGAAFADLQSLAAECGIALPGGIADSTQWLNQMVDKGIPRQVWNGRLSFTTYAKVMGKYVPNYQSQIHFFAKDLRRAMKYWLIGRRELKDLMDQGSQAEGNPGGQPDAARPDRA